MREYLSLCGLLRLVFNLYSSSSATSEALRVCCGSGSISISVSGVCGDSVVVGSRAIVFFSQFALLTFLFFLKMYSAFWNVSASASSSSTGLSGLMITHTHKLTVMKLYYYLSLLLLFVIIIYYFS